MHMFEYGLLGMGKALSIFCYVTVETTSHLEDRN